MGSLRANAPPSSPSPLEGEGWGEGYAPAGAKPPRAAPSSPACPTTRYHRRRPHPAPVSRVVWGSCAQTPRHLRSPLRARAAKSGSRVGERGRAPHRARPPTRPPQRHRRGPARHRRLGASGSCAMRDTTPGPAAGSATPHHRHRNRPPPPSHVARGVAAVRAVTPNRACRIGHTAPPTPSPVTATVPRSKGCCGPRSHNRPRLPARPPRTTDAVPGHRHRPTLQGVSSRPAQTRQAAPASPPTPHHGAPGPTTPPTVLPPSPPLPPLPGHRHRPTLQGVSSRSAQTRQAALPGPAKPHHRRRLRRPPPSRVVWGSCAILPAAPSPNAG